MNITFLCNFDEDEQYDIYEDLVKLLKEKKSKFHNNHQFIYNNIDTTILFKKNKKVVGFIVYKKDNRNKKVSIEVIQSFDKGVGSFMVNYILKKFQGSFNIYATQCLEESLGFWENMGISSYRCSEDYEHCNNTFRI